MNTKKVFVSYGVQAGDEKANNTVSPIYMVLREELTNKCSRGYGKGLKEVAFVLRIDGSVWHWEKSGCDNLKVKKSGETSIDIFMPLEIWENNDVSRIKQFLFKETKRGFYMTIERLESKKISFDKDNLINDFENALNTFIAKDI